MDIKNISVPVKYEFAQTNDDRFVKCKLYVMHDKLNLNNSFFDMTAIEDAKESLKNIPILGFIKKKDGDANIDFAGHEFEFVITENDIEVRYLGRPIGVVPETNSYHYETIDDKVYVVVEGYLWKDYMNEALQIFEENNIKSVSMEIAVDDGEWVDNEEGGYYNIKKYRYTGICVLGDDVPPAMVNAHIEVDKAMFSAVISNMLEEIKNFTENQYSLTSQQIKEQMMIALCKITYKDKWGDDWCRYWYLDHDDKYVYVQDEMEHFQIYGLPYTLNKDTVIIDFENGQKMKIAYVPMELDDNLEFALIPMGYKDREINKVEQEYKQEIEKFKQELTELKQFKENKLKEEKQAQVDGLFAKFEKVLDNLDELKEKAIDMDLVEVEKQLYAMLGQKVYSKTATQDNGIIKMSIDNPKDADNNGYEHIIKKYIKK